MGHLGIYVASTRGVFHHAWGDLSPHGNLRVPPPIPRPPVNKALSIKGILTGGWWPWGGTLRLP